MLRPFRLDDAVAVAEACKDPSIPEFTMMAEDLSEEDARRWIANGLEWWPRGVARFAVTLPPDDGCVGQVGIQFDAQLRRAEAFYWLAPQVRGRGIATEALELVTAWAFQSNGVVRVQLVTHLNNAASQRVAVRCGFHREGILRAWEPVKATQPDVIMWSRLATDGSWC
jgi:ribosomal-protein-alanine N-acetyltransferase